MYNDNSGKEEHLVLIALCQELILYVRSQKKTNIFAIITVKIESHEDH